MRSRVQHIVATRFSIVDARSASKMTPDGRFARAWLEERLELLGRFCLPSLTAQTTDNFVWAVFCDEVTDDDVLLRLREHAATLPGLRIVTTTRDRHHTRTIHDLIDPGADVLITTRLDSDDALSDDYLESVQDYAGAFQRSSQRDLLINVPNGYRLDASNDALYLDWMSFSPFHSLLERPKRHEVKTVLHGGHGRLHYEHPTQQDESQARWMIVVHGGNLVNRIHEFLAPAAPSGPHVPGFSIDYRLAV